MECSCYLIPCPITSDSPIVTSSTAVQELCVSVLVSFIFFSLMPVARVLPACLRGFHHALFLALPSVLEGASPAFLRLLRALKGVREEVSCWSRLAASQKMLSELPSVADSALPNQAPGSWCPEWLPSSSVIIQQHVCEDSLLIQTARWVLICTYPYQECRHLHSNHDLLGNIPR